MKPISDNIIFIDTEFSTLDPYKGEILSIGLVKFTGEELYLELEYKGEISDWVKENILPTLTANKASREEAGEKIKEFVGEGKPYAIGFINQFDSIYIYKLFGIDNHPFYWMPIDFASILFAAGIEPEKILEKGNEFAKNLGVATEKYKQHNALDDARLLRDLYIKYFGKTK